MLTNSKLIPHLLRLSLATVFGSCRKVSAPWGSGPRGLPDRSKWTREYCIVLFCFMQFAKWDPPRGGGRAERGRGENGGEEEEGRKGRDGEREGRNGREGGTGERKEEMGRGVIT